MEGTKTTSPKNPVDVRLEEIPLYELIDHLGKLDREIIDAYFSLSKAIMEFRTRRVTTAEELSQQHEAIQGISEFLRDEIAE